MAAPPRGTRPSDDWDSEGGGSFSLFYDGFSVDGHGDSDSKVGLGGGGVDVCHWEGLGGHWEALEGHWEGLESSGAARGGLGGC